MAGEKSIPRPARESRPVFSEAEPMAEQLVRVVLSLATELAVMRDRLDTVERLLARHGQVTAADMEAYVPDEAAEAERRAWREAYLERLFADLEAEIDEALRRLEAAPDAPPGTSAKSAK